MKDLVNVKIKFREPFRPFAPSVIAARASDYFECSEPSGQYVNRFMLNVVPVRPEKQKDVPAITHVDGTGRLQTVTEDSNARYFHLIKAFGDATGVPIVLNTSFNLRGEPIVNTPQQAFNTFTRSGMDALVLGEYLVEK